MNSNRYLRKVKFAVLALLITALAPRALRADDLGCSVNTLKGSYRFSSAGTVVGVGPLARVGVFSFDGSGNGQSITTTARNGTISPGTTAPITYTVDADCSGTATFTPSGRPPAHINIVVDKEGAGFFFINRDPGFVVSGQAIRLDEDAIGNDLGCSVSTLRGSYRASGGGTVVGVGPIAVVNNLDLDGAGNGQTTAATLAVNGNISSGVMFTSTFTVNADCTGSATFTALGAPPADFNIAVDPKGAGFFFIRADSGFVVSGQVIRLDEEDEQ